jgi:hypothetical protein
MEMNLVILHNKLNSNNRKKENKWYPKEKKIHKRFEGVLSAQQMAILWVKAKSLLLPSGLASTEVG